VLAVAEATLYPPEQYGSRWLMYGIGCVVTVLAGYLVVLRVTKEPRARPSAADASALEQLKRHFLELVDDVERRYMAGSLPEREVFLQLSSLMRRFVFEATGVRAHTWTLAELREAAPASVSDAIAYIYPAEFEPDPADVSARSSIARILEVVSTWS